MSQFLPLAEAGRNRPGHFETRHAGIISAVDGSGCESFALGDTTLSFPLRSVAKPFQLLPFIFDGLHREYPRGADALRPDLAVMMSSHSGEPMHTARVAEILQAHGLEVDLLQCGAHWPYHLESRDALLRAGEAAGPLHSNCSGKHAGMLAVCLHRSWPLDSYLEPEHPLQQWIHDIIAGLSDEPTRPLPHSIDGCSLPTYWLSLRGIARLYASLAQPRSAPRLAAGDSSPALSLIFEAGTRHPELVGGSDRFDTRLMRAFGGRVFGKSGAAGVYAMAVAPCEQFPAGLGIGFKIEDGDADGRVRPLVACEILRQLEVELPAASLLAELADPEVRNVRNLPVGAYRTLFRLR